MSTEIYDFDYEKALQKNSDNFVPLGSKKSKTNIRTSPIVVPVAPVAVKIAKPMPTPMPTHVSVKRAERPTTTTARKAIIQKMPIIVKQNYDYELNRPFSPIQVNSSTTKRDDDDDWGSIYDKDFYGGKKRTRRTRRKRTRNSRSRSVRSERSKRTKKLYSRRYRGRKVR
jgi:hypothetical protein